MSQFEGLKEIQRAQVTAYLRRSAAEPSLSRSNRTPCQLGGPDRGWRDYRRRAGAGRYHYRRCCGEYAEESSY